MSYPQQPGGFNQGGYPQQGSGGQGGFQPQPHGLGQNPGGFGQQPGGFSQGFPNQGFPNQGFQGQGGQPHGGYQQPQFQQAKPKGNLGLWIAVGVLGVAVAGVLLWLFLGTGGQYVGKHMPSLPSSFGSWSKQADDETGISFGDMYTSGGQKVMAIAIPIDPTEKQDPTAPPSELGGAEAPQPRKIGTGMFCSDESVSGVTGTACFGVWEDGVTVFSSDSASAAEAALKDFVGAAK